MPPLCSLRAVDRTTHGDESRTFVDIGVSDVIRSATSARLRLIGSDGNVLTATYRARREKECCAFIDFQLELLSDVVWPEILTPVEASAALDALITRKEG